MIGGVNVSFSEDKETEENVRSYLPEGEEIVASCESDKWEWYCSSNRLIRYQNTESDDTFEDISLREISGISLGQTRRDQIGIIAVIIGLFALVIGFALVFGGSSDLQSIGWLGILIGAIFLFIAIADTSSHETDIEFRGSNLLADESWEIEIDSNENPQDYIEFVRKVSAEIHEID